MAYKFKDGWYVNPETNIKVKEPAFIIDTEIWAILYFGEFFKLEEQFNNMSDMVNIMLFKPDFSNYSVKEAESYLNDLLFNKNFLKFQLLRFIKNSMKGREINVF